MPPGSSDFDDLIKATRLRSGKLGKAGPALKPVTPERESEGNSGSQGGNADIKSSFAAANLTIFAHELHCLVICFGQIEVFSYPLIRRLEIAQKQV